MVEKTPLHIVATNSRAVYHTGWARRFSAYCEMHKIVSIRDQSSRPFNFDWLAFSSQAVANGAQLGDFPRGRVDGISTIPRVFATATEPHSAE